MVHTQTGSSHNDTILLAWHVCSQAVPLHAGGAPAEAGGGGCPGSCREVGDRRMGADLAFMDPAETSQVHIAEVCCMYAKHPVQALGARSTFICFVGSNLHGCCKLAAHCEHNAVIETERG